MSYGRTRLKGLTLCDTRRVFRGYTLLTPVEGRSVWMVDLYGKVVNEWGFQYEAGSHGKLLANGHVLYGGKEEGHALQDIEGATGALVEVDWRGDEAWGYKDPYMHHSSFRMRNGNTLVMKWVELSKRFAEEVAGGDEGSERDGVMWGEVIQEVKPNGKAAWEWVAHEHVGPNELKRCPLCPRDTWLHMNAVGELASGDILVSFCKVNTIGIINRQSGALSWRWGTDGELAHQHAPVVLESGNVLIFDNGYHPNGMAQNYSRLVEVTREGKMVWSYDGPCAGDMKQQIYSSMWSNCQRLPNGNTLGCEGTTGRIFEVTKEGELVWEWVNNLPRCETDPRRSRSYPLYAAFRYGMDYPGLKSMR
jgi:hypothetical protein